MTPERTVAAAFGSGARSLLLVAAGLASLLLWTLGFLHVVFVAGIVYVLGVPLGMYLGVGQEPLGTRRAAWSLAGSWMILCLLLFLRARGLLGEGGGFGSAEMRFFLIFPVAAGLHLVVLYLGVLTGILWMEQIQAEPPE